MKSVRLAWQIFFTAIALGLVLALALAASKVEAQQVEKVEITCTNGWCTVPERQLMLILKARMCGVAT